MAQLTVSAKQSKGTIRRHLFGHFSEHLGRCIYDGLYVGENSKIRNVNGMRADAVEALRAVKIPVLRWPGGCFADEYHWRDGVGPKENRKRMVNTNWGGVVEDNTFGTHEFMELCRQLGCEPYINANLGSGTVQEMSEWVEYLTSSGDSAVARERWANGQREPWAVKYWGVGNESWGCGGNMRPEFYADEFRRYQTYCRNYGSNRLYRIACGPNEGDTEWTNKVMSIAGRFMDGLTMHYYTVPGGWDHKLPATGFTKAQYFETLDRARKMDGLIEGHLAVMDRYDPEHRVGLIVDEWGTWFEAEPGTNPGFLYQQNTLRDAQVAALTLDIFIRHCDRLSMANLAQTVNVLQAMLLTEGDRTVKTPTYHVFDLYKAHQDAAQADVDVQCAQIGENGVTLPQLSASASVKDGLLTITCSNASPTDEMELDILLKDFDATGVRGRILSGSMDMYNDFTSAPAEVRPLEGLTLTGSRVSVRLPACAVAEITLG